MSEMEDLRWEIEHATVGSQLLELRTRLQNTKGMLDTERAALEDAINRRYCLLNAATVGPQKSRW
jgi:hypothetical protein